jgi:hypothetical protein
MSAIRRVPCSVCRAAVIWAVFADGIRRPVEDCPEGEGAIGLQTHLFRGTRAPHVEARHVLIRTSYRPHSCQGRPVAGVGGPLVCLVCRRPMKAHVRARSVCAGCQAAERAALAELAAHLVAAFGAGAALELLTTREQRRP